MHAPLDWGAILYQNQDWIDCVIGHARRCLSKTKHTVSGSQTRISGFKMGIYRAIP